MSASVTLELDPLRSDTLDPRRIAEYLDGLSAQARIAAVRSLDGAAQARLWQSAEGFAPITLNDLIPAGTPALTPVRHYGRNSMPLFQLFEKRFYLTAEGSVAGANFQTMSPLTGPGYFVVSEDSARRELVLDYHALPASKPETWPAIVSNDRGFSRLVYGGHLVDRLRRVSKHVTIGHVARGGKPMKNWFVLCREEAGADAR